MSDAQLRDLERRARTTGAPEDAGSWRAAQVRAGALSEARLTLLAYLGDPGALRALDQPTPPAAPSVDEAVRWLRGLSLWGDLVLYRGALSWLQAAADDGPASLREALARAFADPGETDALALRTAHGDAGRYRLVAAQSCWLTLAYCKPLAQRTAALQGMLDRLLWDHERAFLPPPPASLPERVAGGVDRGGPPGGPDLRARAIEQAAPPHRVAARAHFVEHGPGTYALGDEQVYVQACGYETVQVVMGCFGEHRPLNTLTFRYVGPGSPDDWSVSP